MAAPAIPPIRPGLTTSRGCAVPCASPVSAAITPTTVLRGSRNDYRVELVGFST
ncbi:hypothetical protein [Lentzea sp.]|uniref:hypothetical protein n=1 Tax=Lentzea sp. TaxID=56099 RepID=UPI002CB1834B|nr:hypothetical protein [Lentzea sp.]HUQ56428.1 hypothetical protein [Lentzea sp.]